MYPKFLYHLLRANTLETKGYKRHYNDLRRTTVVLPPLAVRRSIMADLDEEQAAVSQAERLAAKMEQRIRDTIARVWEG